MTDIRKSYIIAKEDKDHFGDGTLDGAYYRAPAGAHFTSSGQVSGGDIYETGNKLRVGSIYGAFTGQWSEKFVADYVHLEVFARFFDTVVTISSSGASLTDGYGTAYGNTEFKYNTTTHKLTDVKMGMTYDIPLPPTNCYKHVFLKRNNKRIGNYVIREKTLHRMVGGEKDQQSLLYGVIPASLSISRSAASSEMNCEMQGYYAKPHVDAVELDSTDWAGDKPVEQDEITQMSCMFIDSIADDTGYVYDVDSHAISIENNASLIRNACSKFAHRYTEGNCSFGWQASTYHNEVIKKFFRRYHSGGKDGTHNEPMNKGMSPMVDCYFATFNGEKAAGGTLADAYRNSTRSMLFWFHNSTIRHMTDPEGNNTVMKQNVSSVKSDWMILEVVNGESKVWRDADKITTPDSPASEPNMTVYNFTTDAYDSGTTPGEGETDSSFVKANMTFSLYKDQSLPILKYVRYAKGLTVNETISDYAILPGSEPGTTGGTSPQTALVGNILSKQICGDLGTKSLAGRTFTALSSLSAVVSKYGAATVPKTVITGTANYIGTEYFLIIKPGTGDAVDKIGYLRIDVTES